MADKIEIKIELKPAQKEDFTDHEGRFVYGTLYFLKSKITGKFDKKLYYIKHDTDKDEFRQRFFAGMVYVAKHPFDYEIEETTLN